MKTAAIILAAGAGSRMRSTLPKVLHPCLGRPLVSYPVGLAVAQKCSPIVVVVDPKGMRTQEYLRAAFPKANLQFEIQAKPLGTADAVRAGMRALSSFRGNVLILNGDVPLLQKSTLQKLHRALGKNDMAFLSAVLDDPTGYGRVLYFGTRVARILEHKDASASQRKIREVNAGVYLCKKALLDSSLKQVRNANNQKEFYLPDIVPVAAEGNGVVSVKAENPDEILGINTRIELARVEAIGRRRLVEEHQRNGVTFVEPSSVVIEATVKLGRDVRIGPGVQLYGETKIAEGAQVDGPSVLLDAAIAKGAHVLSFSHVEQAKVGPGARVGPFARLRPGAQLDDDVRVGNFVEIKKSRLRKGVKAGHLAYLGDADIGDGTNVGAGTITCNYDGVNKHKTKIGKGSFTGSNSTLVAPLKIGNQAYVAAGSTINKNVPSEALAFGRARQENRRGYAKKLLEED